MDRQAIQRWWRSMFKSRADLHVEARQALSEHGFSAEESELLAKCLWLSCRIGKPLSAVAPPELVERIRP